MGPITPGPSLPAPATRRWIPLTEMVRIFAIPAAILALAASATAARPVLSAATRPDIVGSASGSALLVPVGVDGNGPLAMKLLLQSVTVAPSQQEYISIFNPNGYAVDLSNYYVTDAWHASSNTNYIYIANPASGIVGGGAFFDFHARFPAGAAIAAYDTIVVATQGASRFQTAYGRRPAFEFPYPGTNDPSVPDMREAAPGTIPDTPDSASLTNGGESIVVYYWDGLSDLVTDVDYLFWGSNTGSYVVDKSGKSVDGPDGDPTPTAYLADTPPLNQVPVAFTHEFGNAFRREDFTEGTQRSTGGNGVGGRDETSENLNLTWSSDRPAVPPFVKEIPALRAHPGGPYTGMENAPVAFDGSLSTPAAGETITDYDWNFGDGATGTGTAPTHTYTMPGTYSVTLTVTGSGGGTHTASTTAMITSDDPPPDTLTARPGGPYSGTENVPVSFNGSGSTPATGETITGYSWTFGDGGTGAGPTPVHTYTTHGIYTVMLTVTGSGGGTHAASTTATILSVTPGTASKLLLQSVVVAGTPQEYISIYNPNDASVDLSDYYITDAVHGPSSTLYIYLANPSAGIVGGGAFFDFNIRFPSGSTIAPHDTVVVAHKSAATFESVYGRKPAFEIGYPGSNDPAVPDMRPAYPGTMAGDPDSTSLTNSGESVVLYYWDGLSDLVTDVDYLFWGSNTGSYVVDKSGKSVDGPDGDATPTAYLADTPPLNQVPVAFTHEFGNAFRREDFTEGTQRNTGGNGVDGRDETSENLDVTWSSNQPAVPPFVKGVPPAAPVADAGGPYSGIAGMSLAFDASSSTPPPGETLASYVWTFGDAGTGTGVTTAHTYLAAGTFTVVLTVTATGGGVDSDTTTTTIATAGAGGACPEDLVFWRRQCDRRGNAPTEICQEGMDQLWRCVLSGTTVLAWQAGDGSVATTSLLSMTPAEASSELCDQLHPHPMTLLDRAEMQYLVLALNVCSGALAPDIEVVDSFEGTVGMALDSLGYAINTGQDLHPWTSAAARINRGMNLMAMECPDPDSLFGNIPPCSSPTGTDHPKSGIEDDASPGLRAHSGRVAGGAITLEFRVPDAGASEVTIRIFDLSGRLVRNILSDSREVGLHRVEWNLRDETGRHVPSGLYFCSVSVGGRQFTQKLMVTSR